MLPEHRRLAAGQNAAQGKQLMAGHPAQRVWAGYLLGFALGGFFDGILLHQILQWHHLLSAIQDGRFGRIRAQILADGLFHALMYAIALCGLWSLWRSRQDAARLSGTALLADGLIGFGTWHILDAVLSHWILGIHHIRMDAGNPLPWDLLWFAVFGVGVLLAGLVLRRRAVRVHSLDSGRSAPIAMALAVLVAGSVAALPSRDARQVVVLVPPSQVNRMLDGLAAIGGGILWSDRSGAVWVLSVAPDGAAGRLYEHGAWLVSRSPAALGCLAWSR